MKQDNYFLNYEQLLSPWVGKHITLVEIGVFEGGSLFMWRDYLGKDARIIGIDANPDALKLTQHGFEIQIGDQSDPNFWEVFFDRFGQVDVIIDDGGHWNEQQIKTAYLCAHHVRDGGMIITEDTHTSYFNWMGNPSRYSFIEFSKFLIDVINSRSGLVGKDYKSNMASNVYSISFFNSMVCFHIDRARCTASKSIHNNAPFHGTANLGTQTSKYGASIETVKSVILYRFLKLRIPRIFAPLSKIMTFLILRMNNRRLRAYFN